MKKRFIPLLCASMLGLSACASPNAGDSSAAAHKTITPEEAKNIMTDTEGWLLLDVRTEEEYLEAHIGGAVLLPSQRIAAEAEQVLTDKAQTILVYCRSGRRSAAAAKTLADLGYTGVHDFGGIVDWPYDTVTGAPDAPSSP